MIATSAARPVVLVRYRPDVAGQAIRVVHVVPLPLGSRRGAATALCGIQLVPSEMEIVTPGHGMPCTVCLISQLTVSSPPTTVEDAEADYHRWGWPVTVRRDQVWLSLAPNTVALVIPARLATEAIAVLTAWRCQPAVLTHPHAPAPRVVLAGERYPVLLPWPPGVNRITTKLPLPPTLTPQGPLSWIHPPNENSLRLCREIDVLAAIRTTLQ